MTEENEPGTKLATHATSLASLRYDSVRTSLLRAHVDRWQKPRMTLQMPTVLFILGTLVYTGYPFPFLGIALGAAGVAFTAMLYLFITSRRSGLDDRLFHQTQVTLLSCVFTMTLATGGVMSPVFVVFAMVGSLLDLPYPVPPKPRLSTFTLIGIAVLFLLPKSWVGPPLPPDVHALLLTLVSLSTSLTVTLGLVNWASANIQAGQRLERLREDVLTETTGRAKSLESISSRVAHELKNPLASIKGMAQLVERSVEDERAKTRLGVIIQEASRMEVILAEYLSFTRPLEDLRPQRIELRSLLQDVVGIIEARAEAGNVRLALSEETASITADPRRLKEAMLNLLSNALQATPAGGAIQVSAKKTDDGAEIMVRDNGRGMSSDTLSKLGTPFFTTREEGTGLGVVLTRAAITQHGGRVHYDSKLGEGTTVTVTLPREPKDPRGATHGPNPTH